MSNNNTYFMLNYRPDPNGYRLGDIFRFTDTNGKYDYFMLTDMPHASTNDIEFISFTDIAKNCYVLSSVHTPHTDLTLLNLTGFHKLSSVKGN